MASADGASRRLPNLHVYHIISIYAPAHAHAHAPDTHIQPHIQPHIHLHPHSDPHPDQVQWEGSGPAAKPFLVRCRPNEEVGKLLRRALRKSALVHAHVHVAPRCARAHWFLILTHTLAVTLAR